MNSGRRRRMSSSSTASSASPSSLQGSLELPREHAPLFVADSEPDTSLLFHESQKPPCSNDSRNTSLLPISSRLRGNTKELPHTFNESPQSVGFFSQLLSQSEWFEDDTPLDSQGQQPEQELSHQGKEEPPLGRQTFRKGIPPGNQSQHCAFSDSFEFEFVAMDELNPEETIELSDTDVLLVGRDEIVNSHPGNQLFLQILAPFRGEYQSLSPNDIEKKKQIAIHVYKLVREGGTRFIQRSQENGMPEELPETTCVEEIERCLQYEHTPLSHAKVSSDPCEHVPRQEDSTNALTQSMSAEFGFALDPNAAIEEQPLKRKMVAHLTPSHPNARQPAQLVALNKHSATSQLQNPVPEDVFGDVFEDDVFGRSVVKRMAPPRLESRFRDMTTKAPTIDKGFKGFDTSDMVSTSRKHAHIAKLAIEQPDDDSQRRLLSQNDRSSSPQKRYVPFYADEELDLLCNIPEDTQSKPEQDWLTPADSIRHTDDRMVTLSTGDTKVGLSTSSEKQLDAFVWNTSKPLEVEELDILSGQGTAAACHPGNRRYLQKVRELQPAYKERDVEGKAALVLEVYTSVKKCGGRFVRRSSQRNMEVEEIPKEVALKKIQRALRDKSRC